MTYKAVLSADDRTNPGDTKEVPPTMITTKASMKTYWVTCTGGITDNDGVFSTDDTGLQSFLTRLTGFLGKTDTAENPAVLTYGDGTLIMTSAVHAASEGNAVDLAKATFTDAIARAGGWSDLDGDEEDEDSEVWQAVRLFKFETTTVRELEKVA